MPWSRTPAEAVLVSFASGLEWSRGGYGRLSTEGVWGAGCRAALWFGAGRRGTWLSTSVCSSLSPEEGQGRLGPPHFCFTSAFGMAG